MINLKFLNDLLMMKKHYRTCNLCEAMCGIEIEYEGNSVISIKGDKQDSFSEGHICPKAVALKDVYEDPNRLKKPVMKVDGDWKEISWKQAIKTVAENLAKLQKEHGTGSVGIYNGNPVVHNHNTIISAAPFFRALKTPNKYSATSVDQLPHHYMAYLMFGHQLMTPIPDIDRTEYLIILGANPMVSNGSLLSAPNMKKRLQKIQDRGGKIVNVDPRFTETSAKSDQHVYIKPGTDVYFLLAFVHVLFDEGLVNTGKLTDILDGLDEVEEIAKSYSPEKVESITGVSSNIIVNLVREFATKDKAVLYGRMGVCTQEFGGLSMWLVNVINILTANFDEPGGAMFTSPAIDVKPFATKGHINRWASRVRNRPEFANELPVSTLAEDILTEGEGQIKAMVINAGNPVLSTPNGKQLKTAFESLEFMVSIDIYINETSSLANVILPPPTGLEVDHYDLVFHSLAVRNTAKFSKALFKPDAGSMYDYEIFSKLRTEFVKASGRYTLKKRLKNLIGGFITPNKVLDEGLKRGKYKDKLSIKELLKHPHGIDLGPLQAQLPEALYTEDKRIKLIANEIKDDLSRAKSRLDEFDAKAKNLVLIGRRQLRTCNSWLHNSERMLKNNNCSLLIHPNDASALGLNGTEARVKSAVGELTLPYEVTEEIMEGTVSIPHGWGHKGNIDLDVAKTNPGVSINDLTDEHFIDELTGNAALNGVPVEIESA